MSGNINEDNLNALNEEISQYLENEENFEVNEESDLEINNNQNNTPDYNEAFQTDLNYLHSQLESMMKDLDDKNKTIYKLTERNKEKDNDFKKLKNNLNLLKTKCSINDKLRMQINIQNNRMEELENELTLLKFEYLKLQETALNKDGIINEFHNLSEITKDKFKMFEDANRCLREENENLKMKLEEFQSKLIPQETLNLKDNKIAELKNICLKLERHNEEMRRNEEKMKIKFEDKERIFKQRCKERDDNLKNEYVREISNINSSVEFYKLENEKLKMEVKKLKNELEDFESNDTDKDLEFKKVLDNKDRDHEKLKKTLKDLEKEINSLDAKYSEKQNEHINKIKLQEDNINKYLTQISSKDRRIKEFDEELNQCKTFISDLQSLVKEFEIKMDNKETIIDQLKNQNSEILRELNRKEFEYTSYEENKNKEVTELITRISEAESDKIELLNENEDLRANLTCAADKLREMNDLIIDKYQGLELNYHKEINIKDNFERKCRDTIRKLKCNEDTLLSQLNEAKIILSKKDKVIEELKLKFENKIEKVIKYLIIYSVFS